MVQPKSKQTNNNKTKQTKESILEDHTIVKQITIFDLPHGPVAKNLPTNAGDICSIPGPGRFQMPLATKPVCTQLGPCSATGESTSVRSPCTTTRD